MLKLWYFGPLKGRADSLEKTLMLGKIEGKRRRRGQRVRWLDSITDLEQTLGDSEGWAWCSPWVLIELDTTERLNNKNNKCIISFIRNWLQSISSVQFSCSVMSDSLWPHGIAARQASLSFTISWNLLKLMSIELVMPSNHIILWNPLLFLPSIFSSIRVFSNESALHIRWPKFS